jgi:tetratricopeptide (TPR) repeat protein
MSSLALIIGVWAILFIIAFVFIPLWRKRHDAEIGLYARSQDDNKLSVDYALKKLNCKVKWSKDHEDLLAQYDFQSGHFRIRLEKDSPYVRLYYFFFFEAELSDIELVRDVCNQCNQSTETCRLVYSVGDKRGMVDVHIISVLLITDSTVKEVLERAMLNIFSWQNAFVRYYNQLKGQTDENEHDPEKTRATAERELYLLREQEMMHQDEGPDWHEKPTSPFTIKQIVASAMGLNDILPVKLTVYRDQEVTVVDDADNILNYHFSEALISDNHFSVPSAVMKVDFYDPRHPSRVRHLTIDLESEGHTPHTLYYRATLSLTPLSIDENVNVDSLETDRLTCSVLLGHDLTDNKRMTEEFHYVWKEAMAKQKANSTEKLTKDEALLCSVQDPHLAFQLFQGKTLYLEKRYYEAALKLENAFRILQNMLPKNPTRVQEAFFENCYLLGSCYTFLHQYQRACFFLEFTLPLHRVVYTQAYVNCLVNGGDFRAMNVVNNLLADMQMQENSVKAVDPRLQPFVNFLLRRKSTLLVKDERFDEAESILKRMLDDPDNSDFALRELAHIQKLKAKQ